MDFFTIPSIFTGFTSEWVTFTVDLWITFWTVFGSPVVFNEHHTVEDFDGTEGIIVVGVTFSKEEI